MPFLVGNRFSELEMNALLYLLVTAMSCTFSLIRSPSCLT